MVHPYFDIEAFQVKVYLTPDYVTLNQLRKLSELNYFLTSYNISFKYEIRNSMESRL